MPYRGLGAKPDPLDTRDHAEPAGIVRLPPSVDWRQDCTPVRDQGMQGSCTGFAETAAVELAAKLAGRADVPILSPAFTYYRERQREGSAGDCDAGAYPRDGLRSLNHDGACPESLDVYTDRGCQPPSAAALEQAHAFRITRYYRILTMNGIRSALARKLPVVLGITVYESFESTETRTTGRVPLPEPGEAILGGHCMCLVGYRDDDRHAIVKNSWGTGYGDGGYLYLPYEYLANPKLTSDLWAVVL